MEKTGIKFLAYVGKIFLNIFAFGSVVWPLLTWAFGNSFIVLTQFGPPEYISISLVSAVLLLVLNYNLLQSKRPSRQFQLLEDDLTQTYYAFAIRNINKIDGTGSRSYVTQDGWVNSQKVNSKLKKLGLNPPLISSCNNQTWYAYREWIYAMIGFSVVSDLKGAKNYGNNADPNSDHLSSNDDTPKVGGNGDGGSKNSWLGRQWDSIKILWR